METKKISFLIFLFLIVVSIQNAYSSPKRIMIFAGAASKPATEEAVRIFQQKSGISVEVVFGGSGFVLSQMKLTKRGDLYFPGSSDFMEVAKKKGLVFPDSERVVVYLVPAINVQKGNPKWIHTIKDLTKEGVRVAMPCGLALETKSRKACLSPVYITHTQLIQLARKHCLTAITKQ